MTTEISEMTLEAKLAEAEQLADELTGRLILINQEAAQTALRLSELISAAAEEYWTEEDE